MLKSSEREDWLRYPKQQGTKGSLKWIQVLINKFPSFLDNEICAEFNLTKKDIEWLSPLKSDGFAEYRDDAFMQLLGLSEHVDKLHDFWPMRGPQWDALGRLTPSGPYFLVEAKANIQELMTESRAESEESISQIRESLRKTQVFLNCKSNIDWMTTFYQYANRIAHLYFLRNLCRVDAYLVFVYFLHDFTHIPTSKDKWCGAIKLQKQLMGLTRHGMQSHIGEVFIDVRDIEVRQKAPEDPSVPLV